MTNRMIAQEFVIPTVFAVVLGILLSLGAVYLTERYLGPVDHSVAGTR
jgi:hypothetical protein